jgi:hypothetical protein
MQQPKDVLDTTTPLFEMILGARAERSDTAPGFNSWREVGWIFRDSDCIVIERHGEEVRSRVLVDS